MNPVVWIRDLPRHMSEAIGATRYLMTLQGLRRLALIVLLGLTVVSTSIGLTDLIAASEAGKVSSLEMAVVGALATVAIVSMWIALEFTIQLRPWPLKIAPLFVYLLLVLWSIGFGFGFYWKHLASVGVAQTDTRTRIQSVDSSLSDAAGNLNAVQETLNSLIDRLQKQTDLEREHGGACGVPSGVGAGPYWTLRGQISQDVGGLISGMDAGMRTDDESAAGPVATASPSPSPSPLPGTMPAAANPAAGSLSPAAAASATPTPAPKVTSSPGATARPGGNQAPGAARAPAQAAPAFVPSDAQAAGFNTREDAIGAIDRGPLAQRIRALRALAAFEEAAFAGGTDNPEEMRTRLMALGTHASTIITQANGIIQDQKSYIGELNRLSDKLTARGSERYQLGDKVCVDSALSGTLKGAAQRLAQLRTVDAEQARLDPQLGPRATQDAFQRLWKNVFFFLPGMQFTDHDRLSGPDLQALVAAIVVDICICFLTVFGRGHDRVNSIIRLVQRPIPARDLRRRLSSLINWSDPDMRAAFDSSTALFHGQYYLVASEDVPALYPSIRNLQTLIRAAGEGEVIEVADSGGGDDLVHGALVSALTRTLATAARFADPTVVPADPGSFDTARMSVLRLDPDLTFALQTLLSGAEQPVSPRVET